MKPFLEATDDLIIERFAACDRLADVAALLEVRPGTIRHVLYLAQERKHYCELQLPKRDGSPRRICRPPKNLKILQEKLLRVLNLFYVPKPCVFGFVHGRSIVDNALAHAARRIVLSVDIKDFFPTIHIGRIIGLLKSPPYQLGSQAARVLAQIMCHDDGHLPQGAPTSPILSNMICAGLDSELIQLAKRFRLSYSR